MFLWVYGIPHSLKSCQWFTVLQSLWQLLLFPQFNFCGKAEEVEIKLEEDGTKLEGGEMLKGAERNLEEGLNGLEEVEKWEKSLEWKGLPLR